LAFIEISPKFGGLHKEFFQRVHVLSTLGEYRSWVPDNGMTLALLGAGMVGVAAFRAKFAKV